ncbi:tRNA pseudouridine(38-40) synthase TruA [Methanosarcinales archaeon]|nr:MAG: tRNA pseudouridine(38-40) synthase TruA [Methanosarcinales archaeon]
MRVAFKLSYVGSKYSGFQVQPDVATIEAVLFEALVESGLITSPGGARYRSAGRTDRGVHATGQVIAVDTDNPKLAVPRVINSKLPDDVWLWAHAVVGDDFDPRRDAVSRVYRYIMLGTYNVSSMRSATKVLSGTHDFFNFLTQDDTGRSTIRTIHRIDVRVSGHFTILDVTASSFAWHMVRKIATALTMIGSGVRDMTWLAQMLNPEEFEEGLEPAPAYGLILRDVAYENLEWVEDRYAMKRAAEKLRVHLKWHSAMSEILKEMQTTMLK